MVDYFPLLMGWVILLSVLCWLDSLWLHSVDNCIKFGGSRGFLSRVWGFSAGSLALAPHSFSTCCLMPQTPLSIRISWTFYLEAEGPKRAKVKLQAFLSISPHTGRVLLLLNLLGKASHMLLGNTGLIQGEGNGLHILIEQVSCVHREGRTYWQLSFETIHKKGTLFLYAAQIIFSQFLVILSSFPQENYFSYSQSICIW